AYGATTARVVGERVNREATTTWRDLRLSGLQELAHRTSGFFFSSRRRHTRSVSAFLLNRSSDLTCDDKSAQIYARFDKNDWRIQPAEFYRFHDAEVNTFGYF